MNLNLTHAALDFLKQLQTKQYKQAVQAAFELINNPTPHNSSFKMSITANELQNRECMSMCNHQMVKQNFGLNQK